MDISINNSNRITSSAGRTNAGMPVEKVQKMTETGQGYTIVSVQGDAVEITNAGKSAGENASGRFNVFESEDGKVVKIISETGIAADTQT